MVKATEEDLNIKANMLKKLVKMISGNQNISNEFLLTMIKDNYENEEYWQYISDKISFPTAFIILNLESINLQFLIKYQGNNLNSDCLTNMKFMIKIVEEELVNHLIKNIILPPKTIEYFILNVKGDEEKLYWKNLAAYQQLTHDFIKIYGNKLDWENITMHQKLTLDFLIENVKNIAWKRLPLNMCGNQLINDNTIRLFQEYPIWETVGCLANVSTNVIFDNLDRLTNDSILSILRLRELSTEQLEQLLLKLKSTDVQIEVEMWKNISMMVNLTDSFIEKYKDNLDWKELSNNYNFEIKQFKKYNDKIDYEQLSQNFNMNTEWINELKAMNMYDKLDVSFLMELNLINTVN